MESIRFHDKEERDYNKYLFNQEIKFIRSMLLLSIVFYCSFGVLDVLLEVDYLSSFLLIRFGIILPFILIVLFLSYQRFFFDIHQYILTLLYVFASIGIVVMLILNPVQHSYYGGIFLVFGFGFGLLKIKWQFVTVGSFIVIGLHILLAAIYTPDTLLDTLLYSLFYIAFVLISVFGSFSQSVDKRKNYLHEMSLKDDKVSLERRIYENLMDLDSSNRITVYAIASLAESRDAFTGEHIDRVGHLSLTLAEEISDDVYKKNGIDKEDFVQFIELSSTLHDIGKISIAESILMKPGDLTEEERDQMKRHTTVGSDTLSKMKKAYPKNSFVNMGIDVCKSHHENWDGTGYPEGLKGMDIPFSARLVSIIDVYDALISERPYKKAYDIEQSIREIKDLNGTKFDPDIVDAFLKCLDKIKRV